MSRTAKVIDGKWVYDPPFTDAELAAQKQRFSEMCYYRQAPGAQGMDRTLLEDQIKNHGLGEYPDRMKESICQRARKAGIAIAGKIYDPYLADSRGPRDPGAWVGGYDDYIASCKMKDRDCVTTFGRVRHKSSDIKPVEDVPLAESLIQSNMQEYLQRDPGRAKDLGELREEIIETHGAPANKKAMKRKV